MEIVLKAVFYFYLSYVVLSLLIIVINAVVRSRLHSLIDKFNREDEKYIDSYEIVDLVLKDNNVKEEMAFKIGDSNYMSIDKSITLTEDLYGRRSVSAIAIAAHEAGHCVQYFGDGKDELIKRSENEYNVSMFLMFIGALSPLLCLAFESLIPMIFGISLIVVVLMKRILYVKVEKEASELGIKSIVSNNILEGQDLNHAKELLVTAASTYVVSCLSEVASVMGLMLRVLK